MLAIQNSLLLDSVRICSQGMLRLISLQSLEGLGAPRSHILSFRLGSAKELLLPPAFHGHCPNPAPSFASQTLAKDTLLDSSEYATYAVSFWYSGPHSDPIRNSILCTNDPGYRPLRSPKLPWMFCHSSTYMEIPSSREAEDFMTGFGGTS